MQANIPLDPKIICSAMICATRINSLCVGSNNESELGRDGESMPCGERVGLSISS
jgi:hypothetical protein